MQPTLRALPGKLSRKVAGTLLMALALLVPQGAAQDASSAITTLHSFTGTPDASYPNGLIAGKNGVSYGTSLFGGEFTAFPCSVSYPAGCGTVFEMQPPAMPGERWTETILYSFTGTSGDALNPASNLTLASDGTLYGAASGGATGWGAVFALTPPAAPESAWTETVLYSFQWMRPLNNGTAPAGPLLIGQHGELYGIATAGGIMFDSIGFGTVFELIPPASAGGAWTETVLHTFTGGADGRNPYGGLIYGPDRVVYGTTQGGGTSNYGTVFSLTPPTSPGGPWIETILYSFTGPDNGDGSGPRGTLVAGANGELYGTTVEGGDLACNCGIAFSLMPPASPGDDWTETVLHRFSRGSDGATPSAGLALGPHGVLYGVTEFGGSQKQGTVFSLTPPVSPATSWTETVLHSFRTTDGAVPIGSLLMDNGLIFGTTSEGGNAACGVNGCGTVFQLEP
jgi:uncharacterized repeat protein (TIGR03803 family)